MSLDDADRPAPFSPLMRDQSTGIFAVGYQGVPGAYSEKATKQLLGDVNAVGFPNFEDVFAAVENGEMEYGMVPIENSLGGSIHTNYDLLLTYKLHIVAELDFRVEHCLLAMPGVKKADIKKVMSHPQALAQCAHYIQRLPATPMAQYDTAGSAKLLHEQELRDTAAIASNLAAVHYNLEVLDSNIEDDDNNFTRFLLLSREPQTPSPDLQMKTSVVFSFGNSNQQGQLHKALCAFSLRDIDLTKIESRPGRPEALSGMWNTPTEVAGATATATSTAAAAATGPPKKYKYIFYVDLLGFPDQSHVDNALQHLREFCPLVRVLGSYPAGGELIGRVKRRADGMMESPAKETFVPRRRLRIGIIGFGTFGQFLARTLTKYHDVIGTSRSDYSAVAREIGCEFAPMFDTEAFYGSRLDVIIFCMSILSFESMARAIPKDKLENVLLVDVLSVKSHPKNVLKEISPASSDILCTHPMFGPESGKYSWRGLPLMFERVRESRKDVCDLFLEVFEKERCRMIEMSCEDHDRFAAGSQFVTHLTGRILGEQGLSPTPIDTKGFESILKLVNNTSKDSFDLFFGLYKYNLNSEEQILKLESSFARIRRQLQMMKCANSDPPWQDLNPMVESIKPSGTVTLHALTKDLEAAGKPVVSLCVGEPDFPPHARILDATKRALDEGHTRYTGVSGSLEVRQAICAGMERRKGVSYSADEVLVCNGGKQAVYQAVLSVVSPGQDVIVPSPYWVSYPEIVRLAKGNPVFLPTTVEDGYLISADRLARAITPSTRLVVLCNPSNPTGAVQPRATLEAIAEVLRRPPNKHVLVLADEIYERIHYDTEHVCFASLEGMKERTLLINGFSKAYAMTGYRLGYLMADKRFIAAATVLQGQITSCASSVAQRAALEALALPDDCYDGAIKEMREKRDFVEARLKSIPGLKFARPEGAFYYFPDITAFIGAKTPDGVAIQGGDDVCVYLLEKFHTALVPGSAFGEPNAIRISYAASMETLVKAMDNLASCLGSLARA